MPMAQNGQDEDAGRPLAPHPAAPLVLASVIISVSAAKMSRPASALVVGLAASVVVAMPVFLLGAQSVQLSAELGLSTRELGALASLYFSSAAGGSLVLRRAMRGLADVTVIRLGCLTTAASMLLIAVAARSLTSMAVFLATAGAAAAISQPAVNALLASAMPVGRLGLAFGLKQSAIPVAVLFSGLAVPTLALELGWRAVYAVGAGLPVGLLLAMARTPVSRSRAVCAARGNASARSSLLLLALVMGLGSVVGSSLATFLVASAHDAGVSAHDAGWILVAASGTCVVVRLLAGWLIDRRRGDGMGALVALLVAGTVGLLGLAQGAPSLFLVSSLVAFGGAWGWPGVFYFAVVLRNLDSAASATR